MSSEGGSLNSRNSNDDDFIFRKICSDIQYSILVETGQSGIDANVILCIFGDEETTPNLALRKTKDGVDATFQAETIEEFQLDAVDVGKVSLKSTFLLLLSVS